MTAKTGPAAGAGADELAAAVQFKTGAAGGSAQQVDAGQVGHVRRPRPGGHLGGCPGLHDRAVLDHDHPVAERHGVQQVVRDQHVRGVGLAEDVAQDAADVVLIDTSSAASGSSRSSSFGSVTRARAIATRCCWPPDIEPGLASVSLVQVQAGQRLGGLLARRLLVGAPAPQAERHVLQGAHVREKQVVLEHQGDGPLLRRDPDALCGVFEDRAVEDHPAAG